MTDPENVLVLACKAPDASLNTFAAYRALIRRILKDSPPPHCPIKEVYTENDNLHTPLLKTYANQADTTVEPICSDCREVPHSVSKME